MRNCKGGKKELSGMMNVFIILTVLWFHMVCRHMSKFIKLYTLNTSCQLYLNKSAYNFYYNL